MHAHVHLFGASGLSGLELLALLAAEPSVVVGGCASDRFAGERPDALRPGVPGPTFEPEAAVMARVSTGDVVLLATPAEASIPLARRALARGAFVIDLSGAFRLKDAALYAPMYGFNHPAPELLAEAAYGLPELGGDLRGIRLVANPGCYATAAALALLPLVEQGLVGRELIVDAASGTSGAGRQAGEAWSFGEVAADHRAYRVLRHQHTPEIVQTLSGSGRARPWLTLTTKLLPVERGILAACYARLIKPTSNSALIELFRRRYAGHPSVRVLDTPDAVRMKHAAHTDLCLLGVATTDADDDPGRVVVLAAIDNLRKGAASQAIENMRRLLEENRQ